MVSIQQLCWIAGISAETIARAKAEGRLQEEWAQYDLDRYRRLRAECIEIADKITDEYYRAVVINYLVEACIKAGDVDDARALFKHQQIKSLREGLVSKHPELVRPCISEIMGGRATNPLSGQLCRRRSPPATQVRETDGSAGLQAPTA
jgi:pentatricopeptide repeat protein